MEEKQSKFRYLQIYQDIKDKIESGEYEQGRKMNTEKEYQKIYSSFSNFANAFRTVSRLALYIF